MSQAKVSEWIYFLSPVLEEVLMDLGYMPQTGDVYRFNQEDQDYLLVDVTERAIPRPTDHESQKQAYSGKKKRHMMKNLAITDPNGYVLFMSSTYEGSKHDKAIWDELAVDRFEQNLLADLGFLGIDKTHQNVILPFKKAKNRDLTEQQKQINKVISSLRIRVEHAFAGIKRLKIIRNKIRLKSYDIRDQMMRIASALHNFRMTYRSTILNQP